MKKLICCVIGLTGLFASAQETRTKAVKAEKPEKPEQRIYAVRSAEFTGSNTRLMTVSGNSTLNNLKEIEKTPQDYGISISFVNQKFNRNQLEYTELLFQNNGKWETLTFGTENLKMLPFTLVLNNTYKSKDEKTKSIILRNNKNNRENFVKEQVIDLI